MRIDEMKKHIEELQVYVDAYENYKPQNLKQEAVLLYAELNNVQSVAKLLNEKGYRKEGRLVAGKRAQVKIISNDVTEMLNGEVSEGDIFHSLVKKVLKRNRKRKGIVV